MRSVIDGVELKILSLKSASNQNQNEQNVCKLHCFSRLDLLSSIWREQNQEVDILVLEKLV